MRGPSGSVIGLTSAPAITIGAFSAPAVTSQNVPEPAALALLNLGLVGLNVIRRQRA